MARWTFATVPAGSRERCSACIPAGWIDRLQFADEFRAAANQLSLAQPR